MTESALQRKLVLWAKKEAAKAHRDGDARRAAELGAFHSIPNGGARHVATAWKMKLEGARPGVPDLFLPAPRAPWHGLYLELKRPHGGRLGDAQLALHATLFRLGYPVFVADDLDDAVERIEAYLATPPTPWVAP